MEKLISPSLICTDLCNIKNEVKELEDLRIKMLHIDIIDGHFSPDMPLGIGAVKQLRQCTDIIFDVHLMSTDNAPYIDLLIDAGADRICFHTEYENRPLIALRKIKSAGIRAGIAISPETSLESVIHLLSLCDFVLIMRIDAGYAHLKGQTVYSFADEKIAKIKALYPNLEIEVDGRVGFDDIPQLLKLGADSFVSGTRGIFNSENSRYENHKILSSLLKEKNYNV